MPQALVWYVGVVAMLATSTGQVQEARDIVVKAGASIRVRAEHPSVRLCRSEDVVPVLNLTVELKSTVQFTNIGDDEISGRWSAIPSTIQAWTIAKGDELPERKYQAELHWLFAGDMADEMLRPGDTRSSQMDAMLQVWQPGYPSDDGLRRGTRYRIVVQLMDLAEDLRLAPLIYYVTVPTEVTDCH